MSVRDLKYTLREIRSNVFLVTFAKAYDAAMTFCRVQEFYESPKYKGKFVRMSDYARDYALGKKDIFTYSADWRGFNVPSHIIETVHNKLIMEQYDVVNDYDEILIGIVNQIQRKVKGGMYYLIGTSKQKGDASVVKHEIAHGLYTTSHIYHTYVDELIKSLNPKVKQTMYKTLKKLGYHHSVWDDEMNAYLSTGLHKSMKTALVLKHRKPFIKLLKYTS